MFSLLGFSSFIRIALLRISPIFTATDPTTPARRSILCRMPVLEIITSVPVSFT